MVQTPLKTDKFLMTYSLIFTIEAGEVLTALLLAGSKKKIFSMLSFRKNGYVRWK